MSRPLFLSNGRMLVGLNNYGLVHDFYYPYVGLENHTTTRTLRHKIGVWVDGTFSWLDDGSWRIKMDFEPDAMVGFSIASNDFLQISLELHDFVDSASTVFCRNIHIVNNSASKREIRVFLHQVFQIAESSRGDTALYIPDDNVILDYKGNRAFVAYAEFADGQSFDQYSVGNFGIEGKEGTYRDAEDGQLEGNPIEHGHIDSVLRLKRSVAAHSSARIHYWLTAASTNVEAIQLHEKVRMQGLDELHRSTRAYWKAWLAKSSVAQKKIPKEHLLTLKKSLLIIKSHMDVRGAVIASGDSQMLNYARDYYSYCWPRDATFAIWPLIRLGYKAEAEAWFEFARDVLTDEGYLMHKYLPDRSVGSSWHPYVHRHHRELPIQEDETAIILFMIGQYLAHGGDVDFVDRLYRPLIRRAANFLENYIDKQTGLPHASYDLWEERFQTTTYTTAVVFAALKAAAEIAERFHQADDAIRWDTTADQLKIAADKLFNHETGYFYRGFLLNNDNQLEYDATIDVASFYGAVTFGLYSKADDYVRQSLVTLTNTLVDKSPSGGLPRYMHDSYNASSTPHLGNPWFVTTLWYAQYFASVGDMAETKRRLAWVQSKMTLSGVLPEQINPETSAYVSVAPLVWSSAEYVNTVLDYAMAVK